MEELSENTRERQDRHATERAAAKRAATWPEGNYVITVGSVEAQSIGQGAAVKKYSRETAGDYHRGTGGPNVCFLPDNRGRGGTLQTMFRVQSCLLLQC